MKTKTLKTNFLFSTILFALLLLGSFSNFLKPTVFAFDGWLEIVGPDYINVVESPDQVEFTAILSGSERFSSSDIEWYYNGSLISSIYYVQGTTTNSSTLRLTSSFYSGAVSDSFVTVSAKINDGGITVYEAEKEIMIFNQVNEIQLEVRVNGVATNFQNFNLQGVYSPFEFKIISPAIITQNVIWYLKAEDKKYNPMPLQAYPDSYQLSNLKPGTYIMLAKIDDKFSNPISARIYHQSFSSLSLDYQALEKNELGFTTYKFFLQNVTQNHDIENINWYRKGYSTPLQYGGDTFLFEPSSYSTYQIYARYEPDQIESNSFLLEIKIDRTKDILIFASVIVGVMAVGLFILIYRNVKKDKIW